MGFRDTDVAPWTSRPDGLQAIAGSQGQVVNQDSGTDKQVVVPGADKSNRDFDIDGHDLTSSDYDTGIIQVSGSATVNASVESQQSNAFEMKIELYSDDDTKLNTIDQDDLSVLNAGNSGVMTDGVPVFSDKIKVIITDISGNANDIDGSLNINAGPNILTKIMGRDGNVVEANAFQNTPASTDKALNVITAAALNGVGHDELVSRITDASGTQVDPRQQADYDVEYTNIDLNSTGSTTIYNPANDAEVKAVHMANGGGTADARLEVTDGTDTSVIDDPGGGGAIHVTDDIYLDAGDSLQIVVETAEGSALSETASVSRGEL